MKLSNRLIIKGHWGTNTPALSYAVTSPAMVADARKRGTLKGLTAYRADRDTTERDVSVHPLGLSHQRVYDPATNSSAAWLDTENGKAYFNVFSGARGLPVAHLGHTAMAVANYVTSSDFILADTGFCLRLQLNDYAHAEDDEHYDACVLSWGTDAHAWQLVISSGGAAIMQRTASWSVTAENDLWTLLGKRDRTSDDDASIQTLQTQLYSDYTTLNLRGDKDDNGGTFYELTVMPERMGKVSVYNGDEFAGELNCTRILKTRAAGSLWDASPLGIYRTGGHFLWQVGWPEFAQSGEMTFPYYPQNKNGAVNWNVLGAARSITEGANVRAMANEPTGTAIVATDDGDTDTLIVRLTTTNTRQTPWLYAAHALVDAGARNGLSTTKLDTNDKLDSAGNSPIMNIRPAFEGEYRRAQFDITLRDPEGTTFSAVGFHYDTAENHVCDLYIGGAKVLSNGLVKSATPTMLYSTTANQPRSIIAKQETGAELVLCDQWALLEEYLTYDGEIVGDGLMLGEFLRRCLRTVGVKYTEMSSSMTNAYPDGPLLPNAALGESWCIVSGQGTLADFITETIERWGMGKRLWIDGNGVWQFGYRSTSIATVGGQNAAFKSDANHTDQSYPGRFVMMNPLDYARDMTDFYNRITVIGADGFNDKTAWATWVDEPSWSYSANNVPRNFIGRIKAMQPVTDTSCRTYNDCLRAARSLAKNYGRPPQYISFRTYYHYGLFIGSIITCDGVTCEIVRINDADIAADTMQITARVVL